MWLSIWWVKNKNSSMVFYRVNEWISGDFIEKYRYMERARVENSVYEL